ncbi:multidrug efflux system membrane fusion protein [Rhodanobacter sp. K2T2]|uniref:efflux RND transporter periplasmic adaptor subunit n=1 Tax=Rhodanobacter sp. K2T2 TaxID=2723085 RepID=UPI0015CE566E|nr:efflux RND transporter periplasmic adaptor subunit [Rhodanobacter sp. K2T2]NYE27613.1 multidrug efflux system membrane fusion protein [Rhodanobacter sp. K2T2]
MQMTTHVSWRIAARSPLILAVCILAAGCGNSAQNAQMPPSKVSIVTPVATAMTTSVPYTGRLEAMQYVALRARVSGVLKSIDFRDGDRVKAGQRLVEIDPAPFQALHDRDVAKVNEAKARQALASKMFERDMKLKSSGSVSDEDLEKSTAEKAAADGALGSAMAQERVSALDLSYATVVAPADGRISEKKIDAGNFVTGGVSNGTVLATVTSIDPVRVSFDVSEPDYQRFAAAAVGSDTQRTLSIYVGDSQQPRQARVDYAGVEEDRASGTVRLRAILPNADGALLPGFFARVQLPLAGPIQALTVPDALVLSDQDRRLLMVVDKDSKVSPRPVVIGDRDGARRFILSGLIPGDRVIADGLARVRPGDRVEVVPAQTGD